MAWLVSVIGAVVIATALWDVFQTLWHPHGHGPVSKTVMRLIWRASRRAGARGSRLSGPAAMVMVIGTWTSLALVGWALVYWPHLSEGFSYDPGLAPGRRGDLLDALYLSVVTITTLGFGDIVPTTPWLRVLTPIEALLGFVLLTAAVSWVLQVSPVLTRRRALALRIDTLRRTQTATLLPSLQPATAAGLLSELAAGISQVHVDTLQHTEAYYFRDANEQTTLAVSAPYTRELALTAQQSTHADVQHAGAALSAALEDLADALDTQYLHTGADTDTVLRAYQQDQHTPG